MPNNDNNADHDYIYTDTKIGILRNIGNVTDNEVLQFVEAGAMARHSQKQWTNPIPISGYPTLFQIHHYLFQDIYERAEKTNGRNK